MSHNLSADNWRIAKDFADGRKQTLLVADYRSLEVGIQGDLCKRLFDDDQLIVAYAAQFDPKNPVDIHSNNAREVFGTWLKWVVPKRMLVKDERGNKVEVTPEYAGCNVNQIPVAKFKKHPFGGLLREMIKAVWYGMAYGKREYGFQTLLGADGKPIGEKMALKMVNALLDAVPGMRRWDEWVTEFVREHHGIYSLGGRWCDLERECAGDCDDRDWDFKRAVRRALNFPMQATGAEIIGDAMVRVLRDKVLRKLGFRTCLQVHDELVLRGPLDNVVEAQSRLVRHMREATANGTQLLVQVEVSSSYADSYDKAK